MGTQVKLCKHCKWCKPDRSWWWFCLFLPMAPFFAWSARREQWRFAHCAAPETFSEDTLALIPVPPAKSDMSYCSVERKNYGRCGRVAKLFEPRS